MSVALHRQPNVEKNSINRRSIISDFYERAGGSKLHKAFEETHLNNPVKLYARHTDICTHDSDRMVKANGMLR